MNAIYPTDLSDAEWECLTRHLPVRRPRGRPCGHPLRAILDAIFSLLRTGCPWRGRPLGSMLVDTLGLPISLSVTPPSTHDKVGAWRLLAGLTSDDEANL